MDKTSDDVDLYKTSLNVPISQDGNNISVFAPLPLQPNNLQDSIAISSEYFRPTGPERHEKDETVTQSDDRRESCE